MTPEPTSDGIEFAKTIFEHNQNVINLVDAKAGIVLASDGAILALLTGTSYTTVLLVDKMLLVAALIMIASSAVYGFLTIKPRTPSGAAPTKIFFGSINSRAREEYLRDFAPTRREILDDYLNIAYTLASIQKTKFDYLSKSLYCLVIGMIPIICLALTLHF